MGSLNFDPWVSAVGEGFILRTEKEREREGLCEKQRKRREGLCEKQLAGPEASEFLRLLFFLFYGRERGKKKKEENMSFFTKSLCRSD